MAIQNRFSVAAVWLALLVGWIGQAQSPLPTVLQEESTWYQWPASQGGNDHWYGLVRRSLSGSQADQVARQWGGQLADYVDRNERDFVRRMTKLQFHSQPFWIGLSARPGEPLRWTDGTLFNEEDSAFHNWINSTVSTQRMALTPFGTEQLFPDFSYAASLIEITAHPSALPALISRVTVSSSEASVPGYPTTVTGPVKVGSPGDAQFSVQALGPGPIEYQWKVGGIPMPQATNATFNFQLNSLSSGDVAVEVKNPNGGQASDPIPIEVIPFVETGTWSFWKQWTKVRGGNDHWYGVALRGQGFTHAQAQEFSHRLGAELVTLQSREEKAQFHDLFHRNHYESWLGVTTNSVGGWSWLGDFTAADLDWLPGEPAAMTTNSAVIFRSAEQDQCRIAPVESLVATAAMERTNSPADIPPLIFDPRGSLRIPVGYTRSLEFEVVGGPPLTYEWRRDGQTLPGQTNAALELRPTSVLDTGEYVLVVSNAFGTATSAPVKITPFLATPLQLKLSLAEGYARMEFEHPSDADRIALEFSQDLIIWFLRMESTSAGPHEWSEAITPETSQTFYRLRRLP